jgi:hypothetical protein
LVLESKRAAGDQLLPARRERSKAMADQKPDPNKPDPNKPDPNKPNPNKPDPNKPNPNKPDPNKRA